jgi:hypothetical protein
MNYLHSKYIVATGRVADPAIYPRHTSGIDADIREQAIVTVLRRNAVAVPFEVAADQGVEEPYRFDGSPIDRERLVELARGIQLLICPDDRSMRDLPV